MAAHRLGEPGCGRSNIGYDLTQAVLDGSMLKETAAKHHWTRSAPNGAPLGAVVLVGIGLSLVGAGALLWSRHGSAVFIDNPVLAALAWCFGGP
jgi:hypothetical protein